MEVRDSQLASLPIAFCCIICILRMSRAKPLKTRADWVAALRPAGSGECNPHPDNDFDCRLHNCFTDIEIPDSAVATGRVTLEAQAS